MATLTELKGNVILSSDTGTATTVSGNLNLNKPIKPGTDFTYSLTDFTYSLTTATIPNEIGARVDIGGTAGAAVTVTGDNTWRHYLYANNVPKGIYLFQYWANPGIGATYSPGVDSDGFALFDTNIYQRATAFTNVGDQIGVTPTTFQNNSGLLYNLKNGTNQSAVSYPIYIDSATPNVALVMKCTTNINPPTYHGLMLWRIA